MNRLNIGTRLALGFLVLLILLVVQAGIGLWRIHGASEMTEEVVRQRLAVERSITELSTGSALNAVRTIAVGKIDDPYVRHDIEQAMEETAVGLRKLQGEIAKQLTDPGARKLFDIAMEKQATYLRQREQALQARLAGDYRAANEFFENQLEPLVNAYTEGVHDLLMYQRKLIDERADRLDANNAMGIKLLTGLALAAVLIGLFFAYAITRSITGPMRRAVDVATTVSSRDLTATIDVQGNDETSRLLQALKQMSGNLQDVVRDVRGGAESIASAASQIAAGNVDLSSRTEEQASSLAETAATMEQLTTTVKQNADHAGVASGLADTAVQVAVKSGEVVARVVDTVSAINESSKSVADIINVIDTIAFQTNILALNAAVEAARAGEQGRGFAVVASEVRALAQRSASAAREIKDLIDGSVARAAEGNRLATEAGDRMSETVASIRRVTDIMSEITVASREQSVGIEQVNQAVSQMDQVTQQNAALVEEAAAAAASLQEQSARLAGLVATFKLDDTDSARPGQSALPASPVRLALSH